MTGDLELDVIDEEQRRAAYRRVVEPLWRRSSLQFLLDETQLKIRAAIRSSRSRKFYLLCSRRLGKSFTLVAEAFELCLRKAGARVLYLAPEGKDAAEIVTDIAESILASCPEDLRPAYNAQEKFYKFAHNGSIIRFKGVNGEKSDRLRGGAVDLVIVDEAGLMDDLAYTVSSVVLPMVMTTGGRVLFATTPPRTPSHDAALIYEELAGQAATVKFTIRDNVRISDEIKGEFLKEAGEKPEEIPGILVGTALAKTTTALREYFCEFITDANSKALPEWDDAAARESVRVVTAPAYFDAYVAIDPGFNDRAAFLYAFWDFRRAKLCIQRDRLLHQASTLMYADVLSADEGDLWPGRRPYKRVSDVDPRLMKDLWELHGLHVVATEKQDSLGALNLVRTMIQQREIEIDPRCENLIRQMHNATLNKKATDFERTKEMGHFDLVAALKYLCRNIDRSHNPFPRDYREAPKGMFISPKLLARMNNDNTGLGVTADTPFSRRVAKGRRR